MRSRTVSPSRLAAACAAAAQDHGVPVRLILSRDVTRASCAARRRVMIDLRSAGFGPNAIGRAIGRDHATVVHALRQAGRDG